jgi:hypothetical protein
MTPISIAATKDFFCLLTRVQININRAKGGINRAALLNRIIAKGKSPIAKKTINFIAKIKVS